MEEAEGYLSSLRTRMSEEEQCIDFLSENRRVLHQKCSLGVDNFYNEFYKHYLYKRVQRPAESEIELKQSFKKAFCNKDQFTQNRIDRNEEYVKQRKKDFAVSQERVRKLIEKLIDEYEFSVNDMLTRCKNWVQKTDNDTDTKVGEMSQKATNMIIESAHELSSISNALSFLPPYYLSIIRFFHENSDVIDKYSESIPEFQLRNYFHQFRPETQKLFITISEACEPDSMTPPLNERQGRAVCVVSKPLVFNEEQCTRIANKLGWKPVFATHLENAPSDLYSLLSETEDDILIFGFPRTPKELNDIFELFNPIQTEDDSNNFISRPMPSIVQPFDMIIELDIPDEIVLRDVLAQLEDPETGVKYDVRDLTLDTEKELVRLQRASDPTFDIIQFPSRSVTLKVNFDLIRKENEGIYNIVPIESRVLTDELIDHLASLVNNVPQPIAPTYNSDITYPSIIQAIHGINEEIRDFFMQQYRIIEDSYKENVLKSFELLNSAHLSLINHLEKSRAEMKEYLRRPGTSQNLLMEFQEWHCTQVERGMRRMQRVKDECNSRINSLRENLISIENERKAEEEQKQKELLNAPFRQALFELLNNACTMLAQCELDRWVSTRSLMLDLNQVVSDVDLVPPLPRKKLNMAADQARDKARKGIKKVQRNTPSSRNRADSKLQSYDSPLFEQLDGVKKFVSDASVIYVRTTTPVSTRGKTRPGKDKNPFAPHKIAALEEFIQAFQDDDVYLLTKMDQISEIAHNEVQIVQQSFDAFLEDSTNWIQLNYEKRKSILDTAIAYMLKRVGEEEQINHLILLNEDKCTIDTTQLIVGTEQPPQIPPAFPEEFMTEAVSGNPETIMNGIVDFLAQTNTVQ